MQLGRIPLRYSFRSQRKRQVTRMGSQGRTVAKGCLVVLALMVGVPLLIAAVVGVQTWIPLHKATESLVVLDRTLGADAAYVPLPSGRIPTERMETFLELRVRMVAACEDYGSVRRGFDSVAALETKDPGDLSDVGDTASALGGASLAITPFLARYFELRNEALLEASMGLEEYSYIYAACYREQLLSDQTRNEIFSDGEAVSPDAALMIRECLAKQGETQADDSLAVELGKMEQDPTRFPWQDGLPEAVAASIAPYRDRLDDLFCGATAGLEMERNANRALWIAIK